MATYKKAKISSQLQIRIPADLYDKYGFGSEAYIVPTETGIELRPAADAADQGASILQQLLDEGVSGEDLVSEFRKRAKAPADDESISCHVVDTSEK